MNDRSTPPQCAEGAGLVLSQTSDTPTNNAASSEPAEVGKAYIIDRVESRLKRMAKGVKTSARLHQEETQKGGFRHKCAMLTLTYAPDEDWLSGDITGVLKCIREYLRRKGVGFRYTWVLENTKNGRPHYHVLMWLPKGVTLPKPDKRGWWPKGHTRIEWVKKAVGYIAKYTSKGSIPGDMPQGARLHGNGGLTSSGRQERAWWMLPKYVRDYWSEREHMPTRAKGGGWLSRLTGEWMPSAYEILSINPLIVVRTDAFT